MLGQAIGDLLPTAVGVALSPIPIVAVVLMLGTPKARSNGPAFAIGWVAGLVIVSVIVLLVAGDADQADSGSSDVVNIVKLAFGLLLLRIAVQQWRGRPKSGEEPTLPTWMAAIDEFRPGKSLGLGALLSGVNPKNLALTAAAAATIAQAGLSGGETTVAVAVFVVIGSVTVAGPVLVYLLMGDKAAHLLATMKGFMSAYNNVIMMIVCLVLGAKLIGNGIAGLSA